MPFVEQHLQYFAQTMNLANAFVPWRPRPLRNFVRGVAGRECEERLAPNVPDMFGRDALREYCAHPDTTDEMAALAVFAWGGMRMQNARRAWDTRRYWLPVVREIRGNREQIPAVVAYRLFYDRRHGVNGLGPAYYTKLIFFLRQHPDGYIMDQWTARSINLLWTPPFIHLIPYPGGCRVSPENGPDIYEQYCGLVNRLCEVVGERLGRRHLTGAEVEEHLMSSGGRNPGVWRAYVRGRGCAGQ